VWVLGASPAAVRRLASALATENGIDVLASTGIDGLPPKTAPTVCLLLAPDPLEADLAIRSAHELADAGLRESLAHRGVAFHVIHAADDSQRLSHALRALRLRTASAVAARPWAWSCDKCSDPACEHQLFRRFVRMDDGAAVEPAARG
jgi:hypothetical protein